MNSQALKETPKRFIQMLCKNKFLVNILVNKEFVIDNGAQN
jgi:hypothetical protein